jgi:hypothetical protein
MTDADYDGFDWGDSPEAFRWNTEIDVFEIGGKAPGFEYKVNMNVHVFRTPNENEHWSVGGKWGAQDDHEWRHHR